ncbi:dihydrofolate reductase family protein [Feifania hominis]|uniref:Dihydrofolate reductase family protein n=1 Tax=Feifania hominis TaxID=2763660 RepID=A0A926DF41_9FIRM|nr:dihydrofolate reductase family protein [Feifania hominis]MBC8537031.1 dihydrofolate reductase family protein [Feifania hominis]
MDRPVTTLFLLVSADGKISTGETDDFDFDADLPRLPATAAGLAQYYALEQRTDLWSLCSGRVQAKIGVNERPRPERRTAVSFALVDNGHLRESGVKWFCSYAKELAIVTVNPDHPALCMREENLSVLLQERLDLGAALRWLRNQHGCERLTVQTGGTLNALLLRAGLLDYAELIVAPLFVGGSKTPTAIDGAPPAGLDELGMLRLVGCEALEHSYVRLRYQIMSEQKEKGLPV